MPNHCVMSRCVIDDGPWICPVGTSAGQPSDQASRLRAFEQETGLAAPCLRAARCVLKTRRPTHVCCSLFVVRAATEPRSSLLCTSRAHHFVEHASRLILGPPNTAFALHQPTFFPAFVCCGIMNIEPRTRPPRAGTLPPGPESMGLRSWQRCQPTLTRGVSSYSVRRSVNLS